MVLVGSSLLDLPDLRPDYDEDRWIAYGRVGVTIFVCVYTERGDATRIISVRNAEPNEQKNITKSPVDLDAPLSDEEFQRSLNARPVRKARKATGLSQEAFALRYGIPIGTLRDWEQGRRAPDTVAMMYLKLVAENPEPMAGMVSAVEH